MLLLIRGREKEWTCLSSLCSQGVQGGSKHGKFGRVEQYKKKPSFPKSLPVGLPFCSSVETGTLQLPVLHWCHSSMSDDSLRLLAQLEEGGFRRLAARLALLRAYARRREREGLSHTEAQEKTAEAFDQHTAAVDAWVYDVYDSVTARTLRRWANQFREEGLAGLVDRHGRRSQRSCESYFGTGSELRKVALHYIADHPDCTSTELLEELARHVDEENLPTRRTVQRFLRKMGG